MGTMIRIAESVTVAITSVVDAAAPFSSRTPPPSTRPLVQGVGQLTTPPATATSTKKGQGLQTGEPPHGTTATVGEELPRRCRTGVVSMAVITVAAGLTMLMDAVAVVNDGG